MQDGEYEVQLLLSVLVFSLYFGLFWIHILDQAIYPHIPFRSGLFMLHVFACGIWVSFKSGPILDQIKTCSSFFF